PALYPLPLHDALPIFTDRLPHVGAGAAVDVAGLHLAGLGAAREAPIRVDVARSVADRLPDPRTVAHDLATHVAIESAVVLALARSEEHTSELQSRENL